ncbi:DUF5791 family protein [Halopiger djelfimassiliensis]|uniref:DUF5791 family protein n=1 Tax=Halopiger djelfimassiliensis TaxID=1293047 RepID=UPI000677ADEF|nr:DUF5791 family protein [Halopiger djelfimassiliensis]
MFHEQRTTVPESPDELLAEYESDLAALVERHGLEHVVDATDVDRDALEALLEGDAADLDLEEAARIQALEDGVREPETVVTMACEHLLMGMSSAVLDVDAVQSELEIELDAKEIQQKIERRAPMSFAEYAHIQHVIVSNMP